MKKYFAFIVIMALFAGWIAPIFAADKINPNTRKTKHNKLKTAWKYEELKDDMTGEKAYRASLKSDNKIQLQFPYQGGTIGWFQLQKHPRFKENVVFGINKGQLLCSSYEGCIVTLRFDDDEPVEFHAFPPSDNSVDTLFLSGYDEILAKLKKSKYLIIEAKFYQGGMQHFKFNAEGLEWN